MIGIYKTIRRIFEINKHKWSAEKVEGFRDCLYLLVTAIEKHPAFNAHLENDELKKENYELKWKVKKSLENKENQDLKRQLAEAKEKHIEYKRHLTHAQASIETKNKLIKAYRELARKHGLMGQLSKELFEVTELEKLNKE